MVPSARAIFYRLGKYILEKRGKWTCGYERPIFSLRNIGPSGWEVTEEFQVGVITQFAFAIDIQSSYDKNAQGYLFK